MTDEQVQMLMELAGPHEFTRIENRARDAAECVYRTELEIWALRASVRDEARERMALAAEVTELRAELARSADGRT